MHIRFCSENAHHLGIIQCAELCCNNFEEVLEHVLGFGGLFDELRHNSFRESARFEACLHLSSVQWVRTEAHATLHVLTSLGLQEVVFIVTCTKKLISQVQKNTRKRTLECEIMDGMREIMAVGIVSEVGN